MDTSKSSEPEDELSVFKRVFKSFELVYQTHGYKIRTNSDLARALDKLASNSFLFFTKQLTPWSLPTQIYVKDEDAGTCVSPDISVIRKHATPAPFSEGEEMFGNELKANDLICLNIFINFYDIEISMFIGHHIRAKLVKLSVCGEGEQLDYRRESIPGDTPRATVFTALNTEWEGGDCMLRYGGVEVSIDMHPTTIPTVPCLKLAVVAFYAHMEYKFMPVTKGVQVVLQYDVEVTREMSPPNPVYGHTLEEIIPSMRPYKSRSFAPTYSKSEDTLIQAVIKEIQKLHSNGTKTVAFPFSHPYHTKKIKRNHLEGTDAMLFDALKDHFDISIDTLIFDYRGDEELDLAHCIAYGYSAVIETKLSRPTGEIEHPDEHNSDSDDGFTYPYDYPGIMVKKFASFHLPRSSVVEVIWQNYEGQHYSHIRIIYRSVGLFVKSKDMTS